MGLGARLTCGLSALAAAVAALVYLDRALVDLPVYTGAESAHLIRALYGETLAQNPHLVLQLQSGGDLAFALIVRALTYATQNLLPWLRLLSGGAYVAGLLLVFLASRRNLQPKAAAGFLLLALAYPYYRFAFAALPDGWYVGVLGLLILATARLYLSRPLAHAALAGALAGILALLKPQGLAVLAAFLPLALVDLSLGRRDLRIFAGRLVVLAISFLVTVNLLQLAAGQPVTAPLSFYLPKNGVGAITAQGWAVGARALAGMISASVLLASIPAVTGLLRIELRWLWTRRRVRFDLEPQEATFLLTLFTLALTVVLTALLAASAGGDADRIWGRQFEALIPMLWLAAAPFIVEFERGGGRRWRIAMALAPIVGLAGLAVCLFDGLAPQPWDAAALGAFATDSPAYLALSAGAVIAAGAAMSLTAWSTWRVWLACIAALAVISTADDLGWRASEAPARAAMGAELTAAEAIIARRPGDVALVAADPSVARFAYLRLRARPNLVLEKINPTRLSDADMVVAVDAPWPGEGWRVAFRGEKLAVFVR
jgi:hypothetical protein